MIDLSCGCLGILFTAGVLAGFVDSIAGGGGMITIPALLAVGFPPHLALGTNKLQSSFGSLTAALNYRSGNMVRFRELTLGISFTALGAFAGTMTVHVISADFLEHMIPALLVVIFIYMLCNPNLGTVYRPYRIAPWLFYLLFGCLIGFYDGFFGPGTGTIWTIAFVLWLGFDIKKATAHTKVLNFTSNIVALVTFTLGGHVILFPGVTMGLGQIIGAYLGSHLVLKRGTRFVRVFFLCVVAITIAKLLWSTYN
ncbi:MAG: TSUP family transporter [Desulfobacterales bacterium]|nr:TSUP family transporter [Desulfobacterales bacterium]MDD4072260.1 TSUP family transporter [Desulfobacterales bacterium]MDD4392798.1 TSUP family transporter [Desulfobacterales bacterium]